MKKFLLGLAGLVGFTSLASANVVPTDFVLLDASATADITAITGAILVFLGAILVARSVMSFLRR